MPVAVQKLHVLEYASHILEHGIHVLEHGMHVPEHASHVPEHASHVLVIEQCSMHSFWKLTFPKGVVPLFRENVSAQVPGSPRKFQHRIFPYISPLLQSGS